MDFFDIFIVAFDCIYYHVQRLYRCESMMDSYNNVHIIDLQAKEEEAAADC